MWTALLVALLLAADFSTDGMKALEEKRYADAADLFAKAAAADPGDYAAHFHLALSHSLLGNAAQAIPAYRKVLELKPGLYEAELNLGILLLGQKQAAEAIPHLQRATAAKPKEFRPRAYLADALLASGDPAGAEAHYRAAVELDPKSAAAQLGLARSLARQNKLEQAAPLFEQAAQLDAAFRDGLLELASLYEAAGKPDPAIEIYRKFPDNAAAQERMGELLIAAKRFGEAIERLEPGVQSDPTAANALALAYAYRHNKQPEKALPVLEKAVAGDPRHFDLRMTLGSVLSDQKRFGPAAQQFHAAAQIRPESKEAWSALTGMLVLLDDIQNAMAALDKLRALGAETPNHWYLRAIMLDKVQQYKPALEYYEKFLGGSDGKLPDEEFKARQRVRIIKKELEKR
jgi:tetratricopeptide (TPR) repeat protein